MSVAVPHETASHASRRARAVVLGLVAGLLGVFGAWHVSRLHAGAAALACLSGGLPWLMMLPGLWRGQRSSYLGALLLAAPYMAYGLMEVLANPGARHWAAATLFLAFAVAVAAIAYLRLSRPPAPAPT